MSNQASNPTDLYAQLLEVKDGKRGWAKVSKGQIKANGMQWSFVVNACGILGLKLAQHGRHGWTATRYA